ncbi:head GIN domain-containing protein [Sphingomonas sp.]|uniref:head GIN domain-containing protein n=1 Tax=Sphingomonas sp. TaxID=28214 RepID=UPI001B1F7BCB|nr:head GIN domain-containing protein [Sphingomonas sp.]MBO9712407.1 DUF2807 domain-containing protein [Sphingomonas sp.]
MRLLLICAAALPLGACHASWEHKGTEVAPSGTGATRSYAATGFTGVDVRGSDDVIVKAGQAFSVTAQGDSKLLDKLDIRVDGDTLRIGRKESWSWSGGNARITVTMPKLTSASVAGSGNLTADRAEGDFSGDLAGSGNLEVAGLAGGKVDLSVAGSGNIKVSGTAQSLHADTAGSGDIDARGLKTSSANVSVAGSGNVNGNVEGEADVSIVGSGDVDLGASAHCKVSAMGSGEAHCGR